MGDSSFGAWGMEKGARDGKPRASRILSPRELHPSPRVGISLNHTDLSETDTPSLFIFQSSRLCTKTQTSRKKVPVLVLFLKSHILKFLLYLIVAVLK